VKAPMETRIVCNSRPAQHRYSPVHRASLRSWLACTAVCTEKKWRMIPNRSPG